MNVEHEVKLLVQELKRLGSPNADGQITVTFGVLFNDDRCANIFEGEVISCHKDFKMSSSCTMYLICKFGESFTVGKLSLYS